MQSLFSPGFFTENRARLRASVDDEAPIVITANGELQAKGDNPFPFRQDAGFWYLTGVERPDYTLVIGRNETYIIAPERSDIMELFGGVTTTEDVQKQSGIDIVLDADEGWTKLKSDLQKSRRVYTLAATQAYIAVYGLYTNPARARIIRHMKRAMPGLQVTDVRKQIAELRVVKQTPEIAAIRQAVDITCTTLNKVQHSSYDYEYELEADITRGFRRQGATGHAYSPIVAGGLNACTLHYLDNNAHLEPTELVLVDVGAEVSNYAADITRTWSLGKPSARQMAVFDAVDEAVRFAVEQLKPDGPSFYECEQKVRAFIGTKLKQLGLIERADDKEGIGRYYPHAPHYLGLDVHDVGDTRQPLKAGMVLTVEPGIYLPDEKIGVRLEEDILITETGCEILSRSCPRELTPVQ